MNLLEAALAYASIGWAVFPVRPDTKRPRTKHGHLEATTDVAQIRDWWRAQPDDLIAISLAISGLLAVDHDPRNDDLERGYTLDELEQELGYLPRQICARTPSGGSHIILAAPADRRARGKAVLRRQTYKSVDVKWRGYVLVEPSARADGRAYEWEFFEDADQPPPIPEAWLEVICHPAAGAEELDGTLELAPDWEQSSDQVLADVDAEALRIALELLGQRGEGRSTTFQAIRTIFHDYGLGIDDGWPAFVHWNAGCGKPHQEHELHRQISRVAKHEFRGARGWRRVGIPLRTRLGRAPSWEAPAGPEAAPSAGEATEADEDEPTEAAEAEAPAPDAAVSEVDVEAAPAIPALSGLDMMLARMVEASAEIAAAAPAEEPATREHVDAALTFAERKLQRGNAEQIHDGRLLASMRRLTWYPPSEGAERDAAIAEAATVLVRAAPPNATNAQLAAYLPVGASDGCEAIAAARAVPVRPLLPRIERAQRRPEDALGIDPEVWGDGQWEVEASGERFGLPRTNSQANCVLALHRLAVKPWRNLFTGRTIITHPSGNEGPLDDDAFSSLIMRIERVHGFRPDERLLRHVITDVSTQKARHPVREYLDSLEWDGVERMSGRGNWLARYCGAEDTPYTRGVSVSMLVAAVRRVRDPGCKHDLMVILEGSQGAGKSTALSILAVKEDWFTDDVPLHDSAQRVIEALDGRWIAEAGELKGMRQAEVAHLKAFISRRADRARLAYGYYQSERLRQCIFTGTTNELSEYLQDATGNRRFLPVRCGAFDLDALRADVDQLWAEAAALEAAGTSHNLAPELWPVAAAEAEARRAADPFEDVLRAALGQMTGKIRRTCAWRVLGTAPQEADQGFARRVTAAMQVLGWSRARRVFTAASGAHELDVYCYVRGNVPEQEQEIRSKPAGGGVEYVVR